VPPAGHTAGVHQQPARDDTRPRYAPRLVTVRVDGRWLDGWMLDAWREPDGGWCAQVRYGLGVGESFVGVFAEADVRRWVAPED
jgi:hypothetical protein